MSACQLLVAISSRLPHSGSDHRVNTDQEAMRAACGCRDPIAFGEAEAVGPSFMCTWRFMELRNMLKTDISTRAGIAAGQRRVAIRKRFCILSPRQSTRKKIHGAGHMCSTSPALVLTFKAPYCATATSCSVSSLSVNSPRK